MPIEIRELVIKATVTEDNIGATNLSGKPALDNAQAPNEQIINICIEKILAILKDRKER
ncbi:MAG TPA: DUF5908 family protein [Chitinophagaceae bacterium]|jgi:hypothetical protein|nr:DUF5908 family protein [Chitinophagaceae bacterium]